MPDTPSLDEQIGAAERDLVIAESPQARRLAGDTLGCLNAAKLVAAITERDKRAVSGSVFGSRQAS